MARPVLAVQALKLNAIDASIMLQRYRRISGHHAQRQFVLNAVAAARDFDLMISLMYRTKENQQ